MNKIPLVIQMQASDNGGAALCMMLGGFGKYISLHEMRNHCIATRNGSSPAQICAAASHYGLHAQVKTLPAEELPSKTPCLILWKKHCYAVLYKIKKNTVTVLDPAKGKYDLTWEKFLTSYSGKLIELSPGESFTPGGRQESIWSLLKERLLPYKQSLFLLSLFSCISVFTTTVSLTYRRRMLDDVMSGSNPGTWGTVTAMLLLIWLLSSAISVADDLITYRTSRKMAAQSGSALYKRLFRLPMSFYEKTSRGELMNRLEQNNTLGNNLITALVPRIFNCATLIFYLVLIYTYNAAISTILLVVQLVFSLLILRLQAYSVTLSRSNVSLNEQLRSSLMNGLNSIDTIKASGSEGSFFHLWNSHINDRWENDTRLLLCNSAISLLETAKSTASSATILFFGAFLILQGNLTLGMLSCLQSVFGNVSSTLSSALSCSKQLQTMRTNIERVNDISRRELIPEIPLSPDSQPDKLTGEVNISHLTYRYNQGDEPAISDISLHIAPGEMVALVGSSGCGKSTLMKLVAGIYQVQEGSISYSGKAREEIPDIVFHSSIATVDQEVNLFVGTIRENLKMWDTTVEDYEMILAARDAQIHSRIIQNPDGYHAMLQNNGNNYSGGEQQRLELTRALSQEPTLLILDEFTSALDALTEEKVFQAIRDKGTACLIAAHRLSTVSACDKVIVIDHGQILEMGTPAELYAKKGCIMK